MKTFMSTILGAAALAISATAAAIPEGSWDISNAKNSHGIWMNEHGSTDVLGRHYTINSGEFTVDASGATTLTASVTSNTEAGFGFDITADLTYLCSGDDVYTSGNTGCGGVNFSLMQDDGYVNSDLAMQRTWEFFNLDDATFTGTGALSGLVLDLDRKPSDGHKPFRIGFGADWFDLDFGGSGWFDFVVSQNTSGVNAQNGTGDFNLDLTEVSAPGSLPLLGLGLFGLIVLRRKK